MVIFFCEFDKENQVIHRKYNTAPINKWTMESMVQLLQICQPVFLLLTCKCYSHKYFIHQPISLLFNKRLQSLLLTWEKLKIATF